MSQVVTGDAVVLDVPIAQLPLRAASALIDVIVISILLYAGLFIVILGISEMDGALIAGLMIGYAVLAMVGVPTLIESLTRGRSLGKLALGLRVVSDDGGPVRVRQTVVRALTGAVEIYLFSGVPAVICSLFSKRGKRIGDIFAGTMVISERAPKLAPPPAMPPPLASWAQLLDLSGVTPSQADLARQYLARAPQLSPQARATMGSSIATGLLAQIAPPPPPGTPPDYMMAAVLAERHRRAAQRYGQIPGPQWAASDFSARQ